MTLELIASWVVLPLLALAAVLTGVRMLIGPGLPDRVVALDLLTTLGIAIGAVYALAVRQPVYLDVAIVIALLAFLGTVAFANYLERQR